MRVPGAPLEPHCASRDVQCNSSKLYGTECFICCDKFDLDKGRALACTGPRARGHRRGRCIRLKKDSGAKRPVVLVGATDEIAPFDNAAFEKKAGELIGRSARAGSRIGLRPGELASLRKRERGRDN